MAQIALAATAHLTLRGWCSVCELFYIAWSVERWLWILSVNSTHYLTVIPLVLSVCYLCCHLREDMTNRCDIFGTDLRNVFYCCHNVFENIPFRIWVWRTLAHILIFGGLGFVCFLIQIVVVLFLKWPYL